VVCCAWVLRGVISEVDIGLRLCKHVLVLTIDTLANLQARTRRVISITKSRFKLLVVILSSNRGSCLLSVAAKIGSGHQAFGERQ